MPTASRRWVQASVHPDRGVAGSGQHGCLKTRTLYDEATARPSHTSKELNPPA